MMLLKSKAWRHRLKWRAKLRGWVMDLAGKIAYWLSPKSDE